MAVPPELVHSSAVLHTPLNDDEDVVVHSSLGNETTENNEKAPEIKHKSYIGLSFLGAHICNILFSLGKAVAPATRTASTTKFLMIFPNLP